MLTKRWGIFWRPFNFSFHHWSTVILVCMKLHNFCLDRNLDIPVHRFTAVVRDGNEWVVYDNYQEDDVFLRGHARDDHRRDITNKLEQ